MTLSLERNLTIPRKGLSLNQKQRDILNYTVKIDKFMRESETFIKDLNSFNKRNSIKGNRNFYKGFQFLR